jgi:2Fe-2S ferredoxin
VRVHFSTNDGERRTIETHGGVTLMEAAIQNGIEQIDATCGGSCACSTCHVYIDQPWRKVVGEPGELEEETLEMAPGLRKTSRLSCQITLTAEMDGLEVELPEEQA